MAMASFEFGWWNESESIGGCVEYPGPERAAPASRCNDPCIVWIWMRRVLRGFGVWAFSVQCVLNDLLCAYLNVRYG